MRRKTIKIYLNLITELIEELRNKVTWSTFGKVFQSLDDNLKDMIVKKYLERITESRPEYYVAEGKYMWTVQSVKFELGYK